MYMSQGASPKVTYYITLLQSGMAHAPADGHVTLVQEHYIFFLEDTHLKDNKSKEKFRRFPKQTPSRGFSRGFHRAQKLLS